MMLSKRTHRILKFIPVALLIVLPVASPFSFSTSKVSPLRSNIAWAAFTCPARPTNVSPPSSGWENYTIGVEKRDNADGTFSCIYTVKNNNGIGGYTTTQKYDQAENEIKPKLTEILGETKQLGLKPALSCEIGWFDLSPIFSPTCWGRTISVLLGTLLISVTAWLLAAVGLLFNVLVDHTIITFGYLFTAKVGEAIGIAWSAFRDIANIVIIGMFVFIAINMILGVKEFGDKKKVARVLIIAVLLNFSLLFTKVIIDASNFTAMQFYKASQLSTGPETPGDLGNFDEFSKKGISGEFIRLMGLNSLKDTANALSAAAFGNATNQYATANGWVALVHGLVSAALLLAAALVLLYGCFLIASRAILLIILMVTSALAFASWLIPNNYIGEGWDKWWRSLLKAAFFAPILMALLWMALLVARAIQPTKGSLGHLVGNPTGTLDLNALFSYVIIIGLLFVVFKVAGEFSQSISGFAAVASGLKFAGLATVAAPALAWRFGVAPVARQTIGRWAYGKRESLIGDGKSARIEHGELLRQALDAKRANKPKEEARLRAEAAVKAREAGGYGRWAGRVERLAGGGYNIGDVGLVKQLAKVAGMSPEAAGQRGKETPVGYQQAIEQKIKLGEERMKALEVSPAERQKLMDEERDKYYGSTAYKEGRQEHEGGIQAAEVEHGKAKDDYEAHGGEAEFSKLQSEINDQKGRIEAGIRERDIAPLLRQLETTTDAGTRGQLNSQISSHEATIKQLHAEQDKLLKPLADAKDKFAKAATKLQSAGTQLDTYEKAADKIARELGQRKVRDARVGAVGTAEVVGRGSAGVFYTLTGQRGHIGKEVAKKVRGRVGQEGRLRQILDRIPDESLPRGSDSDEAAE